MKDGIINNTGDSRYLKSAIPANITHEQLVELLRNGIFPIDLNGINADGWEQLPTWLSKANLLTDSAANKVWAGDPPAAPTVNLALEKLASWVQIAEFNVAGTYEFTVPDDVDELGVLLMGGGGSGAVTGTVSGDSSARMSTGGSSGVLEQFVLRVKPGETVPGVIGSGGQPTVGTIGNGASGGASSFSGHTAAGGAGGTSSTGFAFTAASPGGQLGDTVAGGVAPYGGALPVTGSTGVSPSGGAYVRNATTIAFNRFDPTDMHVYCGAGGNIRILYTGAVTKQTTVERSKGHAGAGDVLYGGDATAPGDGGGAAISPESTTIKTSGAGADGLCIVYARGGFTLK